MGFLKKLFNRKKETNVTELGSSILELGQSFQEERFEMLNKFYELFEKNSDTEILLFKIKKLSNKSLEFLNKEEIELKTHQENSNKNGEKGNAVAVLLGSFKERNIREDKKFISEILTELETYEAFKENNKISLDDVRKNIWNVLEATKEAKTIKQHK